MEMSSEDVMMMRLLKQAQALTTSGRFERPLFLKARPLQGGPVPAAAEVFRPGRCFFIPARRPRRQPEGAEGERRQGRRGPGACPRGERPPEAKGS